MLSVMTLTAPKCHFPLLPLWHGAHATIFRWHCVLSCKPLKSTAAIRSDHSSQLDRLAIQSHTHNEIYCMVRSLLWHDSLITLHHVAPPRASGRFSGIFFDHICEGIHRAGAEYRVSSLTDSLKMKAPITTAPAIAKAVLRRQFFGSAYHPPEGDQTPCKMKQR